MTVEEIKHIFSIATNDEYTEKDFISLSVERKDLFNVGLNVNSLDTSNTKSNDSFSFKVPKTADSIKAVSEYITNEFETSLDDFLTVLANHQEKPKRKYKNRRS